MKKPCLILALIMFGALTSFAQKYEKYTNHRYFFSIEYPSDIVKIQPPVFNGDGRTFLSKDGSVELRSWANHNVMLHSVEEEARSIEEELKGIPIAYKKISDSWFVLSWVDADKVHYRKTLYHKFKNADVFFTFTIEYPRAQKPKFDAIVRRIEKSFTFDPNADV